MTVTIAVTPSNLRDNGARREPLITVSFFLRIRRHSGDLKIILWTSAMGIRFSKGYANQVAVIHLFSRLW